ncbi:MAG: 3-dehydroquinate synthase [Muribaculaceae bacterium]|nr:3-dehydroquinate synthase [Muribaculaceae bacterium]
MAENYLTHEPASTIDSTIEALEADKVIVVTDENVEKIVIPSLEGSSIVKTSPRIAIIPGEEGKTLETVTKIWDKLEETGATRSSVVLNIGGGVVTDIGGFAASTYKRGVRTVNFPTTLLGAVDAATGGKTGINYRGLKNEIGAFHMPTKVILSAIPFRSLSREELLSGYAEMIKTALFSDKDFYLQLYNLEDVVEDTQILGSAVEKCVGIKDEIVAQDPHEKGLRKVLNLGHTAGHAFESLGIQKGFPVTHGKAVAHGLLVALILSHIKLGFDTYELEQYRRFLREYYGGALMQCEDMEKVLTKMNSDKKNRKYGEPAFTLLKGIGDPVIDCHPSQTELTEALELYIDMAS